MQGEELSRTIGAAAYLECSSKTQQVSSGPLLVPGSISIYMSRGVRRQLGVSEAIIPVLVTNQADF